MKKIVLLVLVLNLISCTEIARKIVNTSENNKRENISESNFVSVKIDDSFSVKIPKYLKKMNQLNKDAILQYGNIYKEAYIVIIKESANEFATFLQKYGEYNKEKSLIENFRDSQLKTIKEGIQIDKIEHYGLIDVNGYKARQFKIFGKVNNLSAAYLFTYIEAEGNIYQIINWTLLNRFDRFESTFEIISASFIANKKQN